MPERLHVGNPKGHGRRGQVFEPALSNQPSGPRQGDSKVALVKQGVRGALRSKNLRLLLEAANAPEVLAVVAEMPLERLQNMAEGALCSDETAYHLEQQLELPSGWLDRMNSAVPENYLTFLANPNRQHEDDTAQSSVVHPPKSAAPSSIALPPKSQAPVPETPSPAKPSEALSPLSSSAPPAEPPKGSKIAALAAMARASMREPLSTGSAAEPAGSNIPAASEVSVTPVVPEISLTSAIPASTSPQQSLLPDTPPVQPQGEAPASAQTSLPSQPDNKPAMTTPTSLHLANLNVLLAGKGAKSALARLLSLSPASVTGMLNGVKPLNDETRYSVTQAVELPADWFEKERMAADIPAATLKLLSPLARGAAAPPAAPKARAVSKPAASESPAGPTGGQAASAMGPTPAPAPKSATGAPQQEEKPTTWPAAGTKVARLRDLTSTSAPSSHSAAPGVAANSGGPAAPAPLQGVTPGGAASTAGEGEQIRVQPKGVPEQQRGDTYPSMTAVLSESGLSPIAEALIKTLAHKASSGALSEDKAFELLGSVRAL